MKHFALVVLTLAVAQTRTASAFQSRAVKPRFSSSTSLDMSSFHTNADPNALGENRNNEEIWNALTTLEGPSINYGHFGRLEGKSELEVKCYDNFDNFKAAIAQVDLTKLLRSKGPFTVFAPTNTALEAFNGIMSEDVIKTHIIAQDLFTDELDGEIETLSGHKITCKKQFRKIYVDEALVGQLDNHTGGTPYPTNVMCENGVIHAINTVLTPGWARCATDSQGVQGLSLQSHLNQDVLKDRGALPDDATSQH